MRRPTATELTTATARHRSHWTGLIPIDGSGSTSSSIKVGWVAALRDTTPSDLPPPGPRPDAGLRDVRIVESGEPLVRLDGHIPCTHAYHRRGLPGASAATWLRAGVADRLARARRQLPPGFDLHVLDGWRDPVTQRALWDEVYHPGSTAEPGWIADPDDTIVPPPHTTGAAVDLTLEWQGIPLGLGVDFDDFGPDAHLVAFEGGDDPGTRLVRDLRRLLSHVLATAGFEPLIEEWWHVSFGDQRWALHRGQQARYAPCPPPGPPGPPAPPGG